MVTLNDLKEELMQDTEFVKEYAELHPEMQAMRVKVTDTSRIKDLQLYISKSVTQDEWDAVYEETLLLLARFPLLRQQKQIVDNQVMHYLVPATEQEAIYNAYHRNLGKGWCTVGCAEELLVEEMVFIPKYLQQTNATNECDAISGAVKTILYDDCFDEIPAQAHTIWKHNIRGRQQFLYLLAIGLLITNRLGSKAFLLTRATLEQMKSAALMVNKYVKTPIPVGDCYNENELTERLHHASITNYESCSLYYEIKNLARKERNIIDNIQHLSAFSPDILLSPQIIRSLKVSMIVLYRWLAMDTVYFDEVAVEELCSAVGCLGLIEPVSKAKLEVIVARIKKDKRNCLRYYALLQAYVKEKKDKAIYFALMMNDDLYEYMLEII